MSLVPKQKQNRVWENGFSTKTEFWIIGSVAKKKSIKNFNPKMEFLRMDSVKKLHKKEFLRIGSELKQVHISCEPNLAPLLQT